MRIKNENILIALSLLVGLVSVLGVIGLSNRILRNNRVENRTVYILAGLTVTLTVCMMILNWLYGTYISEVMFEGMEMTNLHQFEWGVTLDVIIPIFGLLYFLWKIKRNSEVVR